MRTAPDPVREISDQEFMALSNRCRAAVIDRSEIAAQFQRFHRRLRSGLAVLDDGAGGVICGKAAVNLPPLRQLILMALLRHRPAREYYYALQDRTNGTLAAWNEMLVEARYWEVGTRQILGSEETSAARRFLRGTIRQMGKNRVTQYPLTSWASTRPSTAHAVAASTQVLGLLSLTANRSADPKL